MTYTIDITNRMKKDIKLLKKQRKDLAELRTVINLLASGQQLPQKYDDHPLKGSWQGYTNCRDCRLNPLKIRVMSYPPPAETPTA